MSTIFDKSKLILRTTNFRRVSRLSERGEFTELKTAIKAAFGEKYQRNKLVEEEKGIHTSREQWIIRSLPVIKAAQYGHQQVVEYFISEFSDIVEEYLPSTVTSHHSNDVATALHSAAENGHVGILKLLVEADFEVSCRNTNTGWTPLHSAVSSGREDAIQYLISCQADVNAADTNGQTPLHEVIFQHASGVHGKDYAWLCRVVQMLLKHDASVCQADHDGRTAFHNIAELDNDASQQLLKLLLNSNPEHAWTVLQTSSKGQRHTEIPAILYAAEWRNTDFVDFITSQPECSPTIAADALLALSTYQNTYHKTIEIWEKAFNKYGQIPSEKYLPYSYGNRLEICSLDKAHQLISVTTESNDFTDLHYQFLIMRERIFGFGSRATIQYLWEHGHDLCKKNHFVEAKQFYTKALKMMVLNITGEYSQPGCYIRIEDLHTTLHTEYRFDRLVSHMLNGGHDPHFFHIVNYGLELTKHIITKHLIATRYLYPPSVFTAWCVGLR